MTLPVTHQMPIVPVQLYDPWSPPVVPQIQVPQHLQHILPMLTTAIINEAGVKSGSNAARMFCYNLLVRQYWQNEQFNEVVKLAIDMLALNMQKGLCRSPEQAYADVAKEALSLYTSNLVFLYPDLKAYSSPQFLDAAFQNAGALNNIKQEIAGMFVNNPGNGAAFPIYNGQQVQDPRFAGMGGNAHPSMQYYPGGPVPSPVNGYYHPGMVQQVPGMGLGPQNSCYQYPNVFQSNVSSGNTWGGGQAATLPPVDTVDGSQDYRYATRSSSRDVVVAAPPPEVIEEEKPVSKPVYKAQRARIKTKEGSVVEKLHSEIRAFGNVYPAGDVVRAFSSEEKVEDKPALKPPFELLHVAALLGITLQDLFLVSEFTYLTDQQAISNPTSPYRCFGFALNPINSLANLEPLFEELRAPENSTFKSLANKLKYLIGGGGKTDLNAREREYQTAALKLNSFITKLLNEFYSEVLYKDTTVTIASFAEDFEEFVEFVKNRLPPVAIERLLKYEEIFISQFGEKLSADISEIIGAPESVHFEVVPVPYSFTFIPATLTELFEASTWETAVAITKEDAPWLLELSDSLKDQKSGEEGPCINTIRDYFITKDGVWISIDPDPYVPGEYLARMV